MNELGLLATGQWIRLILSCEHSHTHTNIRIYYHHNTKQGVDNQGSNIILSRFANNNDILLARSQIRWMSECPEITQWGQTFLSLSLSSPLPPPPLHPPPPPTTPQLIHPARIALIHLHKHEKTVGIAWAELVTCKEWDPQTCWWWDRGNHNT